MNLKGGYKIISLMAITLVNNSEYTAISDKGILDQLASLKEYLDESKELKPVLLRVKDSANEVVMCELAKKIGEDILYIKAELIDCGLIIKVEFAKDEDTQEIYLDEASYLYVANVDRVAEEVAKAESGTIVNVLGLDSNGELVKQEGTIKKIYYHPISVYKTSYGSFSLVVINNSATPIDTPQKVVDAIAGFDRISPINGNWILDTKTLIFSYAFKQSNYHILMGAFTDGVLEMGSNSYKLEDLLLSENVNVSDGVNAIN